MLQVKDALLDTQENVYDAIIMNPPYFTVPTHSPYYPLYSDVITGRTNIFSFFIVRALSLVKSGGYVAAIVPPSMNNGVYFSRLRKYIADIASIENIVIKGQGQFQAMTEVQIIVLKKGTTSSRFIFRRDNSLIFTADLSYVENQWQGACNIRDLGYKVTVGTIVWNRHDFTDRGIPLVYGRDIQNGKIILDNRENRYLDTNESTVITPPAIMVRRVIGKHPHRKIDAAIADFPCFGENHVNVIQAVRPRVDMMTLLQQLLATPPRYLDAITGSAQLSKVELETLIPLRP